MEIEAIAGDFRRSLDETLRTVHKLTVGSESSAETVLCSMNAVLSEVVNSNFGAAESHASLARLYRVLEHAHTALLGECDNLPLLFFARSFAVVIEEAVRQLTDEGEDEDTVSVPEGAVVVEEEVEVEVDDEEQEEEESTVPLVGEETTTVEAAGEANGDGFAAPIAIVETRQPIVEEKIQKASGDAIVADGYGVAPVDDVIVSDVLGGGATEATVVREKEEDEQSWSSGGTPNEAGLIMMEDSDEEEHAATREVAGRDDAELPRESGASASASAESGWTDGTRPASASLSSTTQLSETSTETTTTKGEEREREQQAAYGVEQQLQPLQLQAPPTGDYAAQQATKGRITIYSIPACARKPDVQAFLWPIGPLRSLCLPTRQYDDKPLGYALAKFETNEEADAAVTRLNGARLCGTPVAVRRAAFTVTYPDAAEFRPASVADTPLAFRDRADSLEEQPPRFGTGQKELVREGADAHPRFRCNPDAPEFRPAAAPIPRIREHAEDESDRFYRQQAATWDEDGVWGSPERERAFVFPVRQRADALRGCYPRQKSCWDADGVWQGDEKW